MSDRGVDAVVRTAQRRVLVPPRLRREIRRAAGLSQSDVARALGVDRATVSRYESGDRTPRRELAERYAELLRRLVSEVGA